MNKDHEMTIKCCNCAWLLIKDSGYSNYTVIETTAYCLHNNNPDLPAETGYSPAYDPGLSEARICDKFLEGQYMKVDVEWEDSDYYKPKHERLMDYTKHAVVRLFLQATKWGDKEGL
jgi:hypothetical protein